MTLKKDYFVFNRQSPGISAVCLALAAGALLLILLGSLLVSTIWMWSWVLGVVLLGLSAWKRIWGLFALGVLLFIFPGVVILLQGI